MVDKDEHVSYDNRVESEHVKEVEQISATEAKWRCSCYVIGHTSRMFEGDDFMARAHSKHADHVDRAIRRRTHYSFEW